jgi:hypothetical protein
MKKLIRGLTALGLVAASSTGCGPSDPSRPLADATRTADVEAGREVMSGLAGTERLVVTRPDDVNHGDSLLLTAEKAP